ncbi:MAG: hypothetical protein K5697_00730 [Lachnospiraceae bacterium]|nr:hypothetical protein [Lachnospiraceae bacterium]
MERMSLDKVLQNVKEGRAISPFGISNLAHRLMNTPLDSMMEKKDREESENNVWLEIVRRCSGTEGVDAVRTYGDLAGHLMALQAKGQHLNTTVLLFLEYLLLDEGKDLKCWLKMSVRDVLSEAGMEKEQRDWFESDLAAWEELCGKTPSVREVLRVCRKKTSYFPDPGIDADPDSEDAGLCIPDKTRIPFERSARDYGLRRDCPEEIVRYERTIVRLQCVWIWMLMVKAPLRICAQKAALAG